MNETVAVASGTRGTGKTTSIGALGTVLADAGHDVLIVDCDFGAPPLADALGMGPPIVTIQDAIDGRSTRHDATYTGPAGVSVVSGVEGGAPDPERLAEFVAGIDAFDVIICDTGHPFSDATAAVLGVADGVLVVSTPDDAARRNTATLHESLRRGEDAPLLGTALTRVGDASATDSWDCELLASIPDSEAVASGASFVLDSPADPASIAYRDLAGDVIGRLRATPGPSKQGVWLFPPADPFFTPNSPTIASVDDGEGEAESDVETDDEVEHERGPTTTERDGANGASSPSSAPSDRATGSDSETGETGDDEGGITLTRRGALAAITAAIGGVSAGILNTSETPEIEAFGYGGRPVTSNGSGTVNATNGTTRSGSLPTGRVTQTEPTSGTGTDGTEQDPSGNETETGDAGNTTAPRNVSNTTATNEELAPGAEPVAEGEETGPSTGESPTNGGGGGGNTGGDDTRTGGGDGSDSGTDGGDDGDDTTDEPTQPSDGQFGTVGYGQGGYGGVA